MSPIQNKNSDPYWIAVVLGLLGGAFVIAVAAALLVPLP